MAYFILGVGVLAWLLIFGRVMMNANPASLAQALRWVGGIVGMGLAIVLGVAGRLFIAIPLAGGAMMLLRRAMLERRVQRQTNATSSVRTLWFEMALDHDTGELDGVVLQGVHQGARLSELDSDALTGLLAGARNDPQSVQLLEAFLDRYHPDWRSATGSSGADGGAGGRASGRSHGQAGNAGSGAGGGMAGGKMDEDAALAVLGLTKGATVDQIRAAHRELMKRVHPDAGGSSFLAAQINQAKDVLLGKT